MDALLLAAADPIIVLSWIDWVILVAFIAFVLGIGFYLKQFARTDEDFFLAGRRNSAWVAGVAFMSANMGAMEVIGYTGMAVKYGMQCAHFYLISAIPAMLILGLVMMPFYYSGRIKSVPGYLKERFDEKTRVFNAFIFSVMMVLVSGVSLHLLALIMQTVLGWDWHICVWVAAALVAIYVSLAGLISAIFTEVMQFFLIWAGILILPVLGLVEIGGPAELGQRLMAVAQAEGHAANYYTSMWSNTTTPDLNPMQVTWMSLILGIGFAIGFGYWTTDFLIIQRAFSARDRRSAQLTPIIGSYFKILLGAVVIATGLLALALMKDPHSGFQLLIKNTATGEVDYDSAMPLMMARFFPRGMIGLGITAIVAMLMAGQAGNMSAFTAVWTYDLYKSVIHRTATEQQMVRMGRIATVAGLGLAVAGAYAARSMPTVIDYLQAISSMILAPGVAIILPGMFIKRMTPNGAFWGMFTGFAASVCMFLIQRYLETYTPEQLQALGLSSPFIFSPVAGTGFMAANFWRSIWAWLISFGVAMIVSLFSRPKPAEELRGLVWGMTDTSDGDQHVAWYRTPWFWALVAFALFLFLNIYFW